jgi:hypothetical protein
MIVALVGPEDLSIIGGHLRSPCKAILCVSEHDVSVWESGRAQEQAARQSASSCEAR